MKINLNKQLVRGECRENTLLHLLALIIFLYLGQTLYINIDNLMEMGPQKIWFIFEIFFILCIFNYLPLIFNIFNSNISYFLKKYLIISKNKILNLQPYIYLTCSIFILFVMYFLKLLNLTKLSYEDYFLNYFFIKTESISLIPFSVSEFRLIFSEFNPKKNISYFRDLVLSIRFSYFLSGNLELFNLFIFLKLEIIGEYFLFKFVEGIKNIEKNVNSLIIFGKFNNIDSSLLYFFTYLIKKYTYVFFFFIKKYIFILKNIIKTVLGFEIVLGRFFLIFESGANLSDPELYYFRGSLLSILKTDNSFFNVFFKQITSFIYENIFIDGISLWLVWLTFIICYVISFSGRKKFFLIENLIFQKHYIYNKMLSFILFLMFICFLTKDIFIFFISFEMILIPLFIYLIFQGSRLNKIHAIKYLTVYTIIGSLFLWYSISYIIEVLGISNYDYIKWVLMNMENLGTRRLLFIFLFLGFAFKVPLVPFHHWLIIAHVEAPTNGSIILAALLLKVGGYGLYRFVFNLFPIEVFQFSTEIMAISIFGFTYATLLAIRQVDVKRYIAYTSIAHMNYSLLGLFSCQDVGISGYMHIMISHGIISTAMFFLIGHIYSNLHFRDTLRLSGLAYIFPKFSSFFFIFSIANMGLPLFSGFPGEFLIFIAVLNVNEFYAFFIIIGFMLSGIYNFFQINKILFSNYSSSVYLKKNNDLDENSILILYILLFWSVILGIFPDIVIKNLEIGF